MSKYFEKKFFLLFLIFPFFNPLALKYIPGLTVIYDVIQIWKFSVAICILIIYFLRCQISSVVGLVILLELVSIITSIFNGVYELKVFSNALLAISMTMLTELAIKTNFKKFSDIYFKILFLLMIINFLLCLVYPNGLTMATLYTNWGNPIYFLNIDNGIIKEIIPLLVIAGYRKANNENANKNKLFRKFYITFLVSFISLFIINSTTGLIVYIIFSSLLIIYSELLKEKYPYKLLVIIYILFMLLIVVSGFDIKFISSINELFNKSSTFTGRMLLWKKAIDLIVKNPLIGYGYTSGNIKVWGGYFSSHNMFLEMLLQNGIFFFIIFTLLTFLAFIRNNKASVQYSNLVFGGLFAYLLVGLMETGINPSYFMLLVMAWYPDANPNIRTRTIKIYRRV